MTWAQMVEYGIEYYRKNCHDWSDSDCINMAIRDADAEFDWR